MLAHSMPTTRVGMAPNATSIVRAGSPTRCPIQPSAAKPEPRSEARNTKSETNPKLQIRMFQSVGRESWIAVFQSLGFVSDFELRIFCREDNKPRNNSVEGSPLLQLEREAIVPESLPTRRTPCQGATRCPNGPAGPKSLTAGNCPIRLNAGGDRLLPGGRSPQKVLVRTAHGEPR